jgi:hypothetical protein
MSKPFTNKFCGRAEDMKTKQSLGKICMQCQSCGKWTERSNICECCFNDKWRAGNIGGCFCKSCNRGFEIFTCTFCNHVNPILPNFRNLIFAHISKSAEEQTTSNFKRSFQVLPITLLLSLAMGYGLAISIPLNIDFSGELFFCSLFSFFPCVIFVALIFRIIFPSDFPPQ